MFIEEIIQSVIYTSAVRDSLPLSVILVAPQGAGKSKTLLRYSGESIHRCDDLTSAGLYDLLMSDRDNKLSHILLGDFNPPLAHKGSVTNLTVSNMLGVMSDGVVEIKDGRRDGKIVHNPVGIITAVTTAMFQKHMKHWQDIGLMRRFLPIFFTYSEATKLEAQNRIGRDEITSQQLSPKIITLPATKALPLIQPEHSEAIKLLARSLGQLLGLILKKKKTQEGQVRWEWVFPQNENVLPMSPQLVLQSLCRAHAILLRRSSIIKEDIDFLARVVDFCNVSRPGIL